MRSEILQLVPPVQDFAETQEFKFDKSFYFIRFHLNSNHCSVGEFARLVAVSPDIHEADRSVEAIEHYQRK